MITFFLTNHGKSKICCKGENTTSCFDIEIADTNESRKKGLMFKDKLKDNEGMLFVFDDEDIYSFWMKNTLIPLVGIRIDKNMEIVDIIPMDPCKTNACPSYHPNAKAKYVLEINQNLITEKNILKIGDFCYLE